MEKGLRGGTVAGGATSSKIARVLIVDDELTTRKLLAAMLEEAGVPCTTASSAEEALEIAPSDRNVIIGSQLLLSRVALRSRRYIELN